MLLELLGPGDGCEAEPKTTHRPGVGGEAVGRRVPSQALLTKWGQG